nr:hypothetical protein CFP56_65530 [Quercus suber]
MDTFDEDRDDHEKFLRVTGHPLIQDAKSDRTVSAHHDGEEDADDDRIAPEDRGDLRYLWLDEYEVTTKWFADTARVRDDVVEVPQSTYCSLEKVRRGFVNPASDSRVPTGTYAGVGKYGGDTENALPSAFARCLIAPSCRTQQESPVLEIGAT